MLDRRSSLVLLAVTLLPTACSNGGGSSAALIQVAAQTPTPGAIDVDRSPTVEVTLSDEVEASSVAGNQIEVHTASGLVAGTTEVIAERVLRFSPSVSLPWGTSVFAKLRAGVRARNGTSVAADVAWEFRVRDPHWGGRTLAIADAGTTRRAVVVALPPSERPFAGFAVVVGADVWTLPDPPTQLTSLVPQPGHEAFPFVPFQVAATQDGSLAGVKLVDRGTTAAPDLFLVMAVRHGNGTWQNEDLRVLTGAAASLLTVEGGNGAFVTGLYRTATASLRFAVGPRATPPMLALFDNPTALIPTTIAAADLDTAVVCQADPLSGPATFTRYDLSTNPPTATATWQRAFGIVATDGAGRVLVLSEGGGQLALDRLAADGTVAAGVAVPTPPAMPLALWRILPGNGAAAAIGTRFAACSSFRLDASDPSPNVRTFELDQDAIDTGAWAACHAPSGDLLLVARLRASTASEGSLFLWRQRPGQDWLGEEIVPEVTGRPLGRPGIAVDVDGLPLIAVPRAAPAEVVVVQAEPPPVYPAPR